MSILGQKKVFFFVVFACIKSGSGYNNSISVLFLDYKGGDYYGGPYPEVCRDVFGKEAK
jgi:hypothetical protein